MRVAAFFRNHWDALLAIVSVNVFIYLFTRHSGIGISPDSVSYYTAAENIRGHFSFTDFNGVPLVDFPLGYPVFLAITSFLSGHSVLAIAPVLNGVLFSGCILLTSMILTGYKKSNAFYKLLFLSVLACSPALLEVYSMLWSETLFIFLSLLFCVVARYYFVSHSYPRLLLWGLIAAMAFVTRYAGISLVITGGALLFFDGSLSAGKKTLHILLYGCMASSLVVINLVRNHLATNSLAGVREKALRSVADNIAQVSGVIAEWLPFLKDHSVAAIILFCVVFIAALCMLFFRALQQQYYHSYETIITCFFVMYLLFIVVVASLSRFEDLSNRLLSPAYIPFLLVASSWIPFAIDRCTRTKRAILITISLLFFGAWQYHQYRLNAASWEGIKDAGIPGYAENPWQQSATMHYLRLHKHELAPVIFSDAPDAVYFLARLHAMALPHKEIRKEIDDLLRNQEFSVIWLNDGFNPDLVDIEFIRQHKKLLDVKTLADGAIYHFSGTVENK